LIPIRNEIHRAVNSAFHEKPLLVSYVFDFFLLYVDKSLGSNKDCVDNRTEWIHAISSQLDNCIYIYAALILKEHITYVR
jgi:hypothetical protein